jgi:hypothetical protein
LKIRVPGWALIYHPCLPRHGQTPARRLHLPESEPLWQAGRGFVVRDWRSGVSAERRHLKIEREMFAAVCRRVATEPEHHSPPLETPRAGIGVKISVVDGTFSVGGCLKIKHWCPKCFYRLDNHAGAAVISWYEADASWYGEGISLYKEMIPWYGETISWYEEIPAWYGEMVPRYGRTAVLLKNRFRDMRKWFLYIRKWCCDMICFLPQIKKVSPDMGKHQKTAIAAAGPAGISVHKCDFTH